MQIRELIVQAVPTGHIEPVETTRADALRELEIAERHLKSAALVSAEDPVGAYQLLYDSARKGIQALLMDLGLRITSQGGHYAFVRVAEVGVFQSPEWTEFRVMRQIRNHLEYPTVGEDEISEPLDPYAFSRGQNSSRRILEDVRAWLNG